MSHHVDSRVGVRSLAVVLAGLATFSAALVLGRTTGGDASPTPAQQLEASSGRPQVPALRPAAPLPALRSQPRSGSGRASRAPAAPTPQPPPQHTSAPQPAPASPPSPEPAPAPRPGGDDGGGGGAG